MNTIDVKAVAAAKDRRTLIDRQKDHKGERSKKSFSPELNLRRLELRSSKQSLTGLLGGGPLSTKNGEDGVSVNMFNVV